jgi:hypothetical protein
LRRAGAPANTVWSVVDQRLRSGGHGSAAIVVFQRAETGLVHAVNGVNYNGNAPDLPVTALGVPHWIDHPRPASGRG